jgi:hypothetical protein
LVFHNLKFGWLFRKSPDRLIGAFFVFSVAFAGGWQFLFKAA